MKSKVTYLNHKTKGNSFICFKKVQIRNDISLYIWIPYLDEDKNDIVTCRWSNASLRECGGLCSSSDIIELNTTYCRLKINNGTHIGFYPVSIQIEDTKSSVPLQFMIKFININNTCKNR